jgi:hypothetical protein
MDQEQHAPATAEADGSATVVNIDDSSEGDEVRRATGWAVAAAGASVMGFISLFRLRTGWDHTRARAFRRLLGVQVESVTGVALGFWSLNRLRNASNDQRGVPIAAAAVILGASNLARVFFWLRQDRPTL